MAAPPGGPHRVRPHRDRARRARAGIGGQRLRELLPDARLTARHVGTRGVHGGCPGRGDRAGQRPHRRGPARAAARLPARRRHRAGCRGRPLPRRRVARPPRRR
ncbi:MAG: hypothetical protein EKK42_26390 [Pseudonocardiaceae bacterium]|nr:MAG: hypothetical protein EKK42_26390 [Pseudonocardiaceae bacterium]